MTAIAQALCARDPSGRRDPALVAKALQHHHLDGWNPTRIAAELNKNRSTISRILRDADTIPTPAPASSSPPISKIGATESPGATRSEADLSRAF
ncbi:helix-turn-helix domain-containing protein [Nocardia fusca]|uniref:helix-turn-helix domain-containing protein n=1 Tax=Nocardia fusca TaxID=941183 RepID=UPI0007A749AA|nr:helix-turn-helix domain-containing protein [Nocardia fusca]